MSRDRRGYFTYDKTPERLGREALREQEAYAGRLQKHTAESDAYAALLRERNDLLASGVARSQLPEIHAKMSPKDIAAATLAHQRLFASAAGRPAAKTAPKPVAPAPEPSFSFKPSAPATSSGIDLTPAPAVTSAPTPSPAIPATGRRFTEPAIGPDGAQMTNLDGSPKFLQRQPNITESNKASFGADFYDISPEEQRNRLRMAPRRENTGVTTNPGTGPFDFHGERLVDTPGGYDASGKGGPSREYNSTHDLTLSHLEKGNPMLPAGASRAILVPEKYRDSAGNGQASVRFGETVPNQSDPDPFAALSKPKPVAPAPALTTGAATGNVTQAEPGPPAAGRVSGADVVPKVSAGIAAPIAIAGKSVASLLPAPAVNLFPKVTGRMGKDTDYASSGGSFGAPASGSVIGKTISAAGNVASKPPFDFKPASPAESVGNAVNAPLAGLDEMRKKTVKTSRPIFSFLDPS